jgi:hypothetical protein
VLIGIALVILPFLGHGFAQGSSAAPGSIRREVFAKGTHGELTVLPGVFIVLHEPITKGTESDAQGAFAIDSPPSRTQQIEADAPGLYAALAVSTDASSTGPVEMNMAAVTSTTSTQRTRLRAIHSAFSRKMLHHA